MRACGGTTSSPSSRLTYTKIPVDVVEKIDVLVERNRNNIITSNPITGEVIIKSKIQSAEQRSKIIEDPCMKKVRMLFDIVNVCHYLEQTQIDLAVAKTAKIEAEDREKIENTQAMEKEGALLKEIVALEELVVSFAEDHQAMQGDIDWELELQGDVKKQLAEVEEKRHFFNQRMEDRNKSMALRIGGERKRCTEIQEENYLTLTELQDEQKENSRLRLYLQRCKSDIDKQFPKPGDAN